MPLPHKQQVLVTNSGNRYQGHAHRDPLFMHARSLTSYGEQPVHPLGSSEPTVGRHCLNSRTKAPSGHLIATKYQESAG